MAGEHPPMDPYGNMGGASSQPPDLSGLRPPPFAAAAAAAPDAHMASVSQPPAWAGLMMPLANTNSAMRATMDNYSHGPPLPRDYATGPSARQDELFACLDTARLHKPWENANPVDYTSSTMNPSLQIQGGSWIGNDDGNEDQRAGHLAGKAPDFVGNSSRLTGGYGGQLHSAGTDGIHPVTAADVAAAMHRPMAATGSMEAQLETEKGLHVTGLHPSITEEALCSHFGLVAPIKAIQSARGPQGLPLVASWITYNNAADCERAFMEMQGRTINGQPYQLAVFERPAGSSEQRAAPMGTAAGIPAAYEDHFENSGGYHGYETGRRESLQSVATSSSISRPSGPNRVSSGLWSPANDQQLLQARAKGMTWAQIQQNLFPDKTPNACRKRHERLMERMGLDDWDTRRMDHIAREYMNVRKQMWTPLAQRMGLPWNVVEQQVMSSGGGFVDMPGFKPST